MKLVLLTSVAVIALTLGTGPIRAQGRDNALATDSGSAGARSGGDVGSAPSRHAAPVKRSKSAPASGQESSGTGIDAQAQSKASPGISGSGKSARESEQREPEAVQSAGVSPDANDEGNKRAAAGNQDQKQSPSGQRASDHKRSGAEQRSGKHTQAKAPANGSRNTTSSERQQEANDHRREDASADDPKAGRQPEARHLDSSKAASAGVQLSDEQKQKVARQLSRKDVKRVSHLNFSATVGVKVPRRVSLHKLPPAIAAIVPNFGGYDYVAVQDEIIIVDPATRKVVNVIKVGDATASISTTSISALSPEKRASIARELIGHGAVARGDKVPSCVELRAVPSTVDEPELRHLRYFAIGDEVVLVNPDSRRVVEILK